VTDKRVALITGAAMGIGAAIAKRLARDGCVVVIADIDGPAAGETAAQLGAQGLDAWPLAMDVGSPESIAAGFAAVAARYERCDVLVNNAGIAKTFGFLDYPTDHWNRVMAVNVSGPMQCGQHAARLMRPRKWGRIINLASVSGMRASAGRTAYGTSKAAVIGLTRQMAIELAEHGITVNAIAPGPIDTPLTRELHSETMRRNYLRAVPAARYGTPDEVAGPVSFLASEDASYITGHILSVDGGFMAAGILEI
jgi:3-oxoacyl-[acyl-carrier protein] reductase